jgi:intraflagellar transport protein 46
LNVSAEVRDLFQYIERYKPHEVELETTLKCFIPEYIPAIGEMDAFVKVPRPDNKPEDLGLKYLDEPSATQSDPTVLELQLRAMSKKLQYGDVVVRSIENAHKNPSAIDKWIQSINDLHRTKPPPQVHYRKNMPDADTLMQQWPEEFEKALETLKLPSPDLDLSLAEYAKVLCAILDIPVYDNPIESLHLMFSLYMDLRENLHIQARDVPAAGGDPDYNAYGGADVMKIVQGSYK